MNRVAYNNALNAFGKAVSSYLSTCAFCFPVETKLGIITELFYVCLFHAFCRLKILINKAPVMLFMKGSKQVRLSVAEYITFKQSFNSDNCLFSLAFLA